MKKYFLSIFILSLFFLANTVHADFSTTGFTGSSCTVSLSGDIFTVTRPDGSCGGTFVVWSSADGYTTPLDDVTDIGGGGTGMLVISSDPATYTIQNVQNAGYGACTGTMATCVGNAAPLGYFDYTIDAPVATNGISAMITSADEGFGSITGFTVSQITDWSSNNLLMLFLGSGLAVLYNLRYWIVALVIIGAIVYFAYRAFRFFQH